VKPWWAPIFLPMQYICRRKYFGTFWHGGPGQCRSMSAHISWPAGCSQPLSYYTEETTSSEENTPARSEWSQLIWTLQGQNRKKQCCGSGMFIPDPTFFHPGSRIRIKELKNFNPKNWFLSSWKNDPGCSSRIRILTFYLSRMPDPGVKKAPDPSSWIRIGKTSKTLLL
jgi:hypothetical protein